ncbi:hypothetical protein AKJ61_04120 [candidate division MSBL1 archaeon SCGC-AAA259B11]|uniref:Uncharacterized protein n=1 Tax=candidate division MSBL1 archaeon SCGC-AAA259B11 TaxID=1698260 RepID=A0A133U3R8_9EURY|nr:hypothetical protein AKJ61_04120 [candidate division MSBL1 archaeon SCGC-AAA259B11]
MGLIYERIFTVSLDCLVLPAIVFLSVIASSRVLGMTLKGPFVSPLRSSLTYLAIGLFLFLLFGGSPNSLPFKPRGLAQPLLLLSLVGVAYPPLSYLVRKHVIFPIVLRSVALIIVGVQLVKLTSTVIPESAVNLAGAASLSFTTLFLLGLREVLPVGLIVGGIVNAFSILKKTENTYVSILGGGSTLIMSCSAF